MRQFRMTAVFSGGKIPNFLIITMVSSKNLTQTFKKILYMFFIYTVRRTMLGIVREGNKIGDGTGRLSLSDCAKHPFTGVSLSTKTTFTAWSCQEHRYDVTVAVNGIKTVLP